MGVEDGELQNPTANAQDFVVYRAKNTTNRSSRSSVDSSHSSSSSSRTKNRASNSSRNSGYYSRGSSQSKLEPYSNSTTECPQFNSSYPNVKLPSSSTSSERSDEKQHSPHASVGWWQPWAYLALAVHETFVSVGQWAWESASSTVGGLVNSAQHRTSSVYESVSSTVGGLVNSAQHRTSSVYESVSSSVGGLVGSAQRRTSSVYDSVKYRSSVAAQDCQEAASSFYEDLHGRLQTGYHGATQEVSNSCNRCKENMQLAVLQTRLRFGLTSNRLSLRSETLRLDAKQKFSEKYDSLVARPIMEMRSKLRSVRNHTTDQVIRCKARITGNVKENIEAVSLKAKEYEDHISDKFPGIVGKTSKPVQVNMFTTCGPCIVVE